MPKQNGFFKLGHKQLRRALTRIQRDVSPTQAARALARYYGWMLQQKRFPRKRPMIHDNDQRIICPFSDDESLVQAIQSLADQAPLPEIRTEPETPKQEPVKKKAEAKVPKQKAAAKRADKVVEPEDAAPTTMTEFMVTYGETTVYTRKDSDLEGYALLIDKKDARHYYRLHKGEWKRVSHFRTLPLAKVKERDLGDNGFALHLLREPVVTAIAVLYAISVMNADTAPAAKAAQPQTAAA